MGRGQKWGLCDGQLGAYLCFLLRPHKTSPGEGRGWCWGTSLSLACKVGPIPTSLEPLSRAPCLEVSTGHQLQPWAYSQNCPLHSLKVSFSFSFSPAASCEGLSGSGLEALGLEAAGTGKTGLGLEQDRGTTSVHPSPLEPFSHPFCLLPSGFEALTPQCDLGVFPSSDSPCLFGCQAQMWACQDTALHDLIPIPPAGLPAPAPSYGMEIVGSVPLPGLNSSGVHFSSTHSLDILKKGSDSQTLLLPFLALFPHPRSPCPVFSTF